MSNTGKWAYRTVRVNRSPEGVDIVVGDSEGDPRTRGRENAHLVLYLRELGEKGWEVCGAFGHIGALTDRADATIILKKPGV